MSSMLHFIDFMNTEKQQCQGFTCKNQQCLCMNEIIGCVTDVHSIHHPSLPHPPAENKYVTPRQ